MPTPTAAPLIAATIGFRQLKIASVIESLGLALLRLVAVVPDLEGAAAAGDVGAGAEGAAGAGDDDGAHLVHRIHAAGRSRSVPGSSTVLKALSLSGRLRVTVITPSARSVSRVSYFMGLALLPDRSAQRGGMSLRDCVVWETFAATDAIRNPGGSRCPDLLKSVEDGVMKIVLNRPEAMNALSAAT